MPINIAVLGVAHGHVNAYLNEWRAHPDLGIRPLLVWDHDATRLAPFASQHDMAPEPDLDRLLARTDIEAVVIASETSLHADLVEKGSAHGKAIVLQKPLALTLAEADRIVRAVERYHTRFTLAWQMRVDPQNVEMRDMVRRKTLGKVFSVRRRHGLPAHVWPNFASTWHVNPNLNRDIWADDAAHPFDFIYWLLGMPLTVTAELATAANDWMPNDNGIAVFRYPDGLLAEVTCSFTCVAAENTTEIFCENGAIIQSFGDVPGCQAPRAAGVCGLKWSDRSGANWTYSLVPSPASHGERIAGLARPLAEFLNGRRVPIATAIEGRDVLRLILASYVSSQEGSRVTVDDERIAEV